MRACCLILVLCFLAIAPNAKIIIDKQDKRHQTNRPEITSAYENLTSPIDKTAKERKNVTAFEVQKPRIVVTLLTNTKQLIPLNDSDNQLEPFRAFDPFQRFLQFFFSSVVRDFAEPPDFFEPERNRTKKDVSVLTTNTTVNSTVAKLVPKRAAQDHSESCKCTRTENKPTFRADKVVRSAGDKNGTTLPIPLNDAKTKPDAEDAPKKQARHYFLSISGGTGNSAVASDKSDILTRKHRVRREHSARFRDANAVQLLMDAMKREAPPETNKSTTSAQNATEDPDIFTEDELRTARGFADLDAEPIPPGGLKYTNGNEYLLTITLPSFLGIALVIGSLYYCMRARGFCCRMFLKDHSKMVTVESTTEDTVTKQ